MSLVLPIGVLLTPHVFLISLLDCLLLIICFLCYYLIRLNWFLYSINVFQCVPTLLFLKLSYTLNLFFALISLIQRSSICLWYYYFYIIFFCSAAHSSIQFFDVFIQWAYPSSADIFDKMFHSNSFNLVLILSIFLSVMERLLQIQGESEKRIPKRYNNTSNILWKANLAFIPWFWIFLNIKKSFLILRTHFLILRNHFLILRNHFLILRIHFLILRIVVYFLIFENAISNITNITTSCNWFTTSCNSLIHLQLVEIHLQLVEIHF